MDALLVAPGLQSNCLVRFCFPRCVLSRPARLAGYGERRRGRDGEGLGERARECATGGCRIDARGVLFGKGCPRRLQNGRNVQAHQRRYQRTCANASKVAAPAQGQKYQSDHDTQHATLVPRDPPSPPLTRKLGVISQVSDTVVLRISRAQVSQRTSRQQHPPPMHGRECRAVPSTWPCSVELQQARQRCCEQVRAEAAEALGKLGEACARHAAELAKCLGDEWVRRVSSYRQLGRRSIRNAARLGATCESCGPAERRRASSLHASRIRPLVHGRDCRGGAILVAVLVAL